MGLPQGDVFGSWRHTRLIPRDVPAPSLGALSQGYIPVLCCAEPKLFVGASLLAIHLTAKSIVGVPNHNKLAPTGALFWPVSCCNNQLGHSL